MINKSIKIAIMLSLFFVIGCNHVTKYRITQWQGAFFVDDTTVGLVGWEYDHERPDDSWSTGSSYNCVQSFYTYNINDSTMTHKFNLNSTNGYDNDWGVYFSHPWMFYMTYSSTSGTGAIGNVCNIETGVVEETPAGIPSGISKSGRYVLYQGGYYYDREKDVKVDLPDNLRPYYFDEDSLSLYCGISNVTYKNLYWGRYGLNDSILDTIRILYTKLAINVDSIMIMPGQIMSNGKFIYYQEGIGNIIQDINDFNSNSYDDTLVVLAKGDVDTSTGYYLYGQAGITMGNYKDNTIKEFSIAEYNEVEK